MAAGKGAVRVAKLANLFHLTASRPACYTSANTETFSCFLYYALTRVSPPGSPPCGQPRSFRHQARAALLSDRAKLSRHPAIRFRAWREVRVGSMWPLLSLPMDCLFVASPLTRFPRSSFGCLPACCAPWVAPVHPGNKRKSYFSHDSRVYLIKEIGPLQRRKCLVEKFNTYAGFDTCDPVAHGVHTALGGVGLDHER